MREDSIISSSLSPAPSSQNIAKPTSSQLNNKNYGESRQLPFELAQHVQIYFEEAMFTQAFRLLLSIVSADASSTSTRNITIPPASYLSLAGTITVHPMFTTRSTSIEKREQINAAYRLLRLLLRSAGPINAGFQESFKFNRYDSRPSHRHNESEDADADDHQLNSTYAQTDSLWSRAEDFWAVVGWAMNCSCLPGMYAARWEYWSLWLEYMLEVLETDWQLHHTKDTSEESLLWQYIELAPGGNTRARRMLRAIFADGRTRSLNEFHEIFRKELKEPPTENEKIKKRQADVNIEQEEYGDYLNRDDTDTSEDENNDTTVAQTRQNPHRTRNRTRTPTRHAATPKTSSQSLRSDNDNHQTSTTQRNTLSQSLNHRLRLLHLLSLPSTHPTLTSSNPTAFPSPDDLFTLYVEFIKPLPLPSFISIILPNHSLPPATHLPLVEFLLQRSIESSAPSVRSHTPLTQSKLEEEYLPFAASKGSVDANCRVGLLLEALMRRLNENGMLSDDGTGKLKEAVEIGIERRLDRIGERRRGGGGVGKDEDASAWEWLVESAERMRVLVSALR